MQDRFDDGYAQTQPPLPPHKNDGTGARHAARHGGRSSAARYAAFPTIGRTAATTTHKKAGHIHMARYHGAHVKSSSAALEKGSPAGRIVLTIFLILLLLIACAAAFGVKTVREALRVRDEEKSVVTELTAVKNTLLPDITGAGGASKTGTSGTAASGASTAGATTTGDGAPTVRDAAERTKNTGQARTATVVQTDSSSKTNASSRIAASLQKAQKASSEANRLTHQWNWTLLTRMPKIGNDITTVRGLTKAADTVTQTILPNYLKVYDSLSGTKLGSGSNGLDLTPLIKLEKPLSTADTALRQTAALVNSLPAGRVRQVTAARTKVSAKLTPIVSKSHTLTGGFTLLVKLVGSSSPTTYVVDNITPSEIGAGGGLVGSLGALHMGSGKITIGDFQSNADVLNELTSGRKYVNDLSNAEQIFNQPVRSYSFDVRDVNLDPDFTHVATNLINAWNTSKYGASDKGTGVLQVDPTFVQTLVGITGSITLPNGVVLDGSNTARYLENTIYTQVTNPDLQNAYFAVITQTAISNFTSKMTMSSLLSFAKKLPDLLSSRHLAVYSKDPAAQKTIDSLGMTPRPQTGTTTPKLGLYTNEKAGSKMAFYESRWIDVKQTGGPTTDGVKGRRTYRVIYTATNAISAAQALALPKYITGGGVNQEDRLLVYAPEGGSVSDLTSDQLQTPISQHTWNGKKLSVIYTKLQPGQTQHVSLTVTTSPDAVHGLTIDKTPSCR